MENTPTRFSVPGRVLHDAPQPPPKRLNFVQRVVSLLPVSRSCVLEHVAPRQKPTHLPAEVHGHNVAFMHAAAAGQGVGIAPGSPSCCSLVCTRVGRRGAADNPFQLERTFLHTTSCEPPNSKKNHFTRKHMPGTDRVNLPLKLFHLLSLLVGVRILK